MNLFVNKNIFDFSSSIRLITISAAASLLLVACSQTETIESSLQTVQSIISASNAASNAASNTASNTESHIHYELTYDADFPCKASLQENWQDTETDWQQTYRFDLTDIEPNTFVQSKSGRRAVIYTGFKKPRHGVKKVFSEKRINNIRYRSSISEKNQQQIISAMNRAIALCEEKYLF